MSWQKIHSFSLDHHENFCFAGDNSGQIHVLRTSDLKPIQIVRGHTGEINAVATHPKLPLIASLGEDRLVCVWSFDSNGLLTKKLSYSLRGHYPSGTSKFRTPVHSTSQALAFHAEKPWIVSRTAASAVMEMDIGSGEPRLIRCYAADEEWDLATIRYVGSTDDVLTGTVRGRALLLRDGKTIRQWKVEDETIHWFEPASDGSFYLASDARRVVRLDPNRDDLVAQGPRFARDDFEHITQCPTTGRLFAASFDRNVYEIDPETLEPKGVAYRAPFKTRWIKILRSSPSTLLVQCRNGGVYKVDISLGSEMAVYKKSPPTIWTGAIKADGSLLFSGEGPTIKSGHVECGSDPYFAQSQIPLKTLEIGELGESYTKRLAAHPKNDQAILGRTDGQIFLLEGSKVIQKRDLSSAVRDVTYSPNGDFIFAATEAGHVVKLDGQSLQVLARFECPEPLWSLAASPDGQWLATAQRKGDLFLLNQSDLKVSQTFKDVSRLPKRMKWLNNNQLLFTHSNEIYELNLSERSITAAYTKMRNTVEDFVWTHDERYLIAATYHRVLFLFDLKSKEMLWVTADQMDYTKGLMALPPTHYPYEFLSFGRTGVPMHFQIYEEKILALGRIS